MECATPDLGVLGLSHTLHIEMTLNIREKVAEKQDITEIKLEAAYGRGAWVA